MSMVPCAFTFEKPNFEFEKLHRCPRPLLAPFWYPGQPFCILRLLWKTMEKAGRARGGSRTRFSFALSLLKLCFNSFGTLRLEISISLLVCSGHLLLRASRSKLGRLGLLTKKILSRQGTLTIAYMPLKLQTGCLLLAHT